MNTQVGFAEFGARLRQFISRAEHGTGTAEPGNAFAALARELFRLQFQLNGAYRRWCEARSISPDAIADWREIPAVPASAFKELEMTSLAAEERTTVFLSSGTMEQRRSRHFHSAE